MHIVADMQGVGIPDIPTSSDIGSATRGGRDRQSMCTLGIIPLLHSPYGLLVPNLLFRVLFRSARASWNTSVR